MNCLKINLSFLVVLLFFPCSAFAAIDIDGRLNESEWSNAQIFKDFTVVDPLTMEKPGLSTEALVLSTPEGLAVAFICEDPNMENLTHTKTQRDATRFDADSVSLIVDFNGSGQIAYEFSVSISGSYRDGTIINEKESSYEWDGVWKHAVNEMGDRWTAEILLPWSIVTMQGGSAEKRQIAVCFQRQLQSTNEKYSFPAVSSSRTHFVSEFARIEVKKYSSQELNITPYATALGNLLDNSTTGKAGLDLSWKPSGKLNVIATFNPDFGTVESDDLVINFSAIETVFSEKRPFFIEDQRIFDDQMFMDTIFYSRRVGGASDKDRTASDVEAALKIVGSTDRVNFGVFAAQEAGDAGRSFYAGRVVFPKDKWTVGMLNTYVDRPFLNRTALVNSIDYNLSLGDSTKLVGHLMGSRITTDGNKSDGYGIFNEFRYSIKDHWFYILTLQRFNDTFELNDMGYSKRNNFDVLYLANSYNQTNFSEDSRTASIYWTLGTEYIRTLDGFRLPTTISFSRNEKMRNGAGFNAQISYDTNGYDDLISRNNGNVWLNGRWTGSLSYNTQRKGMWGKSISFKLFQEGIEDWAVGFTSNVTWYPSEKLNFNLSFNPQRSSDWLKWIMGKQFGSFSKDQVTATIGMNWFPAEDHEIRLRTQWYTVNAKAEQSYNIGINSRLVADNAPLRDFAATSFALQLRYRYEIAPMSYLYICYSRGGNDYIDDPEKDTLGLLGESTNLRDSDQILVKLSYRFKVF